MPSGPNGSAPDSASLLKALPAGQRKIVAAVVDRFQRELISALPELNAGVNTSQASGSFSATLSVLKAKKGRFKGALACRVRTPREPWELDLHIDDDGQLSLGLPKGWEAQGDDDPDADPPAPNGGTRVAFFPSRQ